MVLREWEAKARVVQEEVILGGRSSPFLASK